MDNIGEIVQSVEGIAGSVVDVQIVELGSISSVRMVVDSVEGGSEVRSDHDATRVRIVEEGILAMNVVGDAERVYC
ncbi:hypothetical protein CTI12_AA367430 [Artemisia annua]|uniref:Uncharacterized protein n=1 Tax=Artemisia annua TaxID=35608 RepID=A0A2U1MGI6_ARTAN|nr:hypothetical protein CTI12_AA367430 [Artemisia annua]